MVVALALGAWPASAEDPLRDDELVVRQEGAHRLLLPKDWPVEHREDGVIQPVPVEQYLTLKFGRVADALDDVEQRLTRLEEALARLDAVDQALAQRLHALEADVGVRPPAGPSPLHGQGLESGDRPPPGPSPLQGRVPEKGGE